MFVRKAPIEEETPPATEARLKYLVRSPGGAFSGEKRVLHWGNVATYAATHCAARKPEASKHRGEHD